MLTKEVMYAVVRLGVKLSVFNKNKNPADPKCLVLGSSLQVSILFMCSNSNSLLICCNMIILVILYYMKCFIRGANLFGTLYHKPDSK